MRPSIKKTRTVETKELIHLICLYIFLNVMFLFIIHFVSSHLQTCYKDAAKPSQTLLLIAIHLAISFPEWSCIFLRVRNHSSLSAMSFRCQWRAHHLVLVTVTRRVLGTLVVTCGFLVTSSFVQFGTWKSKKTSWV